jgi:hypothetical protein
VPEPRFASHEWLRARIEVRRRQLAEETDPDERQALMTVILELEGTLDEHVLAVQAAE